MLRRLCSNVVRRPRLYFTSSELPRLVASNQFGNPESSIDTIVMRALHKAHKQKEDQIVFMIDTLSTIEERLRESHQKRAIHVKESVALRWKLDRPDAQALQVEVLKVPESRYDVEQTEKEVEDVMQTSGVRSVETKEALDMSSVGAARMLYGQRFELDALQHLQQKYGWIVERNSVRRSIHLPLGISNPTTELFGIADAIGRERTAPEIPFVIEVKCRTKRHDDWQPHVKLMDRIQVLAYLEMYPEADHGRLVEFDADAQWLAVHRVDRDPLLWRVCVRKLQHICVVIRQALEVEQVREGQFTNLAPEERISLILKWLAELPKDIPNSNTGA